MIDIAIQKSFIAKSSSGLNLKIDIKIDSPQIIGIRGVSGAGKTTLFRMLSGLVIPSSGTISVNRKVWFSSDNRINIAPQKRTCGYLFQEATLLPNFSLFENIRFANTDLSPLEINEYLKDVDLQGQKDVYPSLLSGGQQKRGALLVALAQSNDVVLLDEPLVALDTESQTKVKKLIKRIQEERNCTVLIASHNESVFEELCSQTFTL